VPVQDSEREELYQGLETCMPAIPWRALKVHREELGVRPLAGGPGSTARLTREAVLETHPRLANLRLVLGGKLTTARVLMDQLATQLTGTPCPASATEPLVRWDSV
jgi:glycerol-3-phosphate dehydrogenase